MRLLFALLLLPGASLSAEWMWQHPVPQGNTLWKIHFYDEWYGYAVGDFGTILFSNDHGVSWEIQYEAVTDNLRDIHMSGPVTGWIVGDNGTILHTTNGGAQWIEQPSGVAQGLNAVFFIDSLRGWACGDRKTVLSTTNGGASWTPQLLPTGMNSIGANDIFFISATEGWVVGSGGYIWKSTDGGAVWSQQAATGVTAQSVKFRSASTGIVVGINGSIRRTTDGGATWTPVASPTSFGLNDILLAAVPEVYVAGDNGTLLHSTNDGASWTRDTLATYASLHGVQLAGAVMTVVGEFGVMGRRIATDPWQFSNPGTNRAANWVTFGNATHGFCAGQYGTIYRTTDGGDLWTEIVNGLTGDSFYGAEMAGPDRVWMVGDFGALLHSSDGGGSWAAQNSQTANSLLSVSFVNENSGWAVGDLGTLLKTSNGGATWSLLNIGYGTTIFFGVKFKDVLNGWIVGDNGLILRTTNGGGSWTPQTSGTANALFYVDFLDLYNGYAAGSGGTILKTTNGGAVWNLMPTGTTRTIYLVGGVVQGSLWAVGDSGLVLHSSNAGVSWTPEFAKTGYDLFGLRVLSDSVAWLCGDNGTIMKTGGSLPFTTVDVPVRGGWNLTSTPVLRPAGADSVYQVFPTAFASSVFRFEPGVGYVQSGVVQPGRGYWMKFPGDHTATVSGSPLMTVVASVSDGWNIVGGIGEPIDTSAVSTIPAGIRVSDWYTYDGGYSAVGQLLPGKAYWVKVSATGQFVLTVQGPQVGSSLPAAVPVPSGSSSGALSSKFRNARLRTVPGR